MAFQKATRKRAFIKMAVTGTSGSGKTYSSLLLAYGLTGAWDKIAVIDTENGSADLYADLGDYSTMQINAPYTTKKYTDAIGEAVAAGFEVLIIDSLTHAWAGEGGLLQQKEALDARGGNKFTNWGSITKNHEVFKAHILESPIHIIGTMRSKTEYALGTDNKPQKIGTAPIQRDGMEYEFSVVLDVIASHDAYAVKDRTGLFGGLSGALTVNHGQSLRKWLDGGAVTEAPAEAAPSPHKIASDKYASLIRSLSPERKKHWVAIITERFGGTNLSKVAVDKIETLNAEIENDDPFAGQEAPADTPATDAHPKACDGCGKGLTLIQAELSWRNYSKELCATCQSDENRKVAALVAQG